MKNVSKIIKSVFIITVFLSSGMLNYATSVSSNDGSAFITKAEFDSLKNNFQTKLDQYNTGIDSKIDAAIAAYLGNIKIGVKEKTFKTAVYDLAFPLSLYNDMTYGTKASCVDQMLWRPKYSIWVLWQKYVNLDINTIDERAAGATTWNPKITDFWQTRKVDIGGGNKALQLIGTYDDFVDTYNFTTFSYQDGFNYGSGYQHDFLKQMYVWCILDNPSAITTADSTASWDTLTREASAGFLSHKKYTFQLNTDTNLHFNNSVIILARANNLSIGDNGKTDQADKKKAVAGGSGVWFEPVPFSHRNDMIEDLNVARSLDRLYIGNRDTLIPTVDENGIYVSSFKGHEDLHIWYGTSVPADAWNSGKINTVGANHESGAFAHSYLGGIYLPPYMITNELEDPTLNQWHENSLVKASHCFIKTTDTVNDTLSYNIYPTDGFYLGTLSEECDKVTFDFKFSDVTANTYIYFRKTPITDDDYNSTTKNLKMEDGSYYKTLTNTATIFTFDNINANDKVYFKVYNATKKYDVLAKMDKRPTGKMHFDK